MSLKCENPLDKCLNTEGICIVSASYGENCGVEKGMYTNLVNKECFGKYKCDYKVDHTKIGDPA